MCLSRATVTWVAEVALTAAFVIAAVAQNGEGGDVRNWRRKDDLRKRERERERERENSNP